MRQKRILALLLCAALLLPLLPTASAAAGTRYLVTAVRAAMLPQPDLTLLPVSEIPGGTYVYAAEERDDFLYVRYNAAGLSGWVHVSLLTCAETDPERTGGVSAVYVKTPPYKTVYTEDEETFVSDGLTLYARYTDGRPDAPVTGWRLFAPMTDSAGEKTATVVYRAPGADVFFSASFSVTVRRVPLKKISVDKAPRTEWIERQTFAPDGMVLRAEYTDGRPDRLFSAEEVLSDPDFTLTDCHGETGGEPLAVGTHKVHITYKYGEIACDLPLQVRPRTLTDLWMETPPGKTTAYSKTELPDLTGLTLTALYDNGETETVLPAQCEFDCDPARFVLGPGNRGTVRYGGKSVTLEFRLAQEIPTELRIVTPDVLAFVLGEPVDLSGLKVYIGYNSGRREETKDYTLSPVNERQTGAQTVTVTCGEFSNVFTIYIQEFYRLGDVSGDGQIEVYDARLVLRAAVGFINYKGRLFTAADADRNGEIEVNDARLVLRAAVGLENLS